MNPYLFSLVFTVGLLATMAESQYGTLGSQSYYRHGIRLASLTRAAKPSVATEDLTPLQDAHPLVRLRVRSLSQHEWALFTVAGWSFRGNLSAIRGHLALDDGRTTVSLVLYLNYWVLAWPLALAAVESRFVVPILSLAAAVGAMQFFRFLGVLRRASQ